MITPTQYSQLSGFNVESCGWGHLCDVIRRGIRACHVGGVLSSTKFRSDILAKIELVDDENLIPSAVRVTWVPARRREVDELVSVETIDFSRTAQKSIDVCGPMVWLLRADGEMMTLLFLSPALPIKQTPVPIRPYG